MLNYLNGVDEIGAFKKIKAKRKAKLIKRKAIQQKAINKIVKKQVSQVQKANILNTAIKKANAVKKLSPLAVTRIKKQAVVDMNRKNFEEEGEPIVTEVPTEIIESANNKFDEGLEEIQAPENLNPDEADSDEGGEEIGRIGKGKLKKKFKNLKAKIKDKTKNLGQKVRKFTPIIALARASFLTLIKFNVFKLREKIIEGYKKNPRKIENWWVGTWGGNLKVLLKSLKISKIGMIGEPVTIATALVSASGVVVSIIEVLKSMNIKVDKNENPPLEELETEQEPEQEPDAMEENAEIGVYYPQFSGKKPKAPKKPKTPKAPKKPKAPRVKGQGLEKFNTGLNKAQNLLNITKSATDQIFKGKKPVKASRALTSLKKDEATTETANKNKKFLIFGGIGAVALYMLMKKK
jgi:hypothetical protein